MDDKFSVETTIDDVTAFVTLDGGEDLYYYQLMLFADDVIFPYVTFAPKEENKTRVVITKLPKGWFTNF